MKKAALEGGHLSIIVRLILSIRKEVLVAYMFSFLKCSEISLSFQLRYSCTLPLVALLCVESRYLI